MILIRLLVLLQIVKTIIEHREYLRLAVFHTIIPHGIQTAIERLNAVVGRWLKSEPIKVSISRRHMTEAVIEYGIKSGMHIVDLLLHPLYPILHSDLSHALPPPGTTPLLPLTFRPASLHLPLRMRGPCSVCTPGVVLRTHCTIRVATAPDHPIHNLPCLHLRLKQGSVAEVAFTRAIEMRQQMLGACPQQLECLVADKAVHAYLHVQRATALAVRLVMGRQPV
jgi:hypothetical protein